MAPQRQKRTRRKLPSRNVVDAEFVSSSASARVMDDLLLPSNHDRTILSQLWDNQETTTRSELPHVVVTSTQRRLVQPSTNTVQQTYLQRLQEQTKDTTDLSAQSFIPITLVKNMNTRATAAAAGSDSEEEETYTNLSPISQQVGMGSEQDFSHGVSYDHFSQNNTDETDQLQSSLTALQVAHIDSLHKNDILHNENDIPKNLLLEDSHVTELIEHEPDHSNVPMVVKHDSAVNDQAPVSMSQAVMMEYKGMMEAEDVNEKDMEVEIVIEKDDVMNVNEKDKIVDTVNEKDDCVNNVDKRDGPKEGEAIEEGMEEEEAVEAVEAVGANEEETVEVVEAVEANEEEAVEAVEAVEAAEAVEAIEEGMEEKEAVEAVEANEEEAVEAVEAVEANEEEAVEANEGGAVEEALVEVAKEGAGADEKVLVEASEAIEEEAGEAIKVEVDETIEEEAGEAIEEEAGEAIEEAVDEAMEEVVDETMEEAVEIMEEVVEEEPAENQVNKEKVPVETNAPSYDADEEITIRVRSTEPVPCIFLAVNTPLQRDVDLVLIKEEPLDDDSYHSDQSMNNVSSHLDEHMNDVFSSLSQEFTEPANAAVSDHSIEVANTAVSDHYLQVANAAVSDHYEPANAAVSDHYEVANTAIFDHSDEFANTAVFDHSDEVFNSDLSGYYVETVNNGTYYSSENTTYDRSDEIMNISSDEFKNDVANWHSDNYISEEEALSLQVQYEEPSSCLYRMSVSDEREDSLVPIKQEPIDDLEIPESLINQHNLASPFGMHLSVDTDVVIKQEPVNQMEMEYQSPNLQDNNPEISDMEEIEYSEELNEAETDQNDTDDGMLTVKVKKNHSDTLSVKPQEYSDCYKSIENLAGQEVAKEAVDSPSVSSNSSSIGDDDWLTVDDLNDNSDDDDQDLVYQNIFDVMSMAKDKPITAKPGQNKGQKRLRPNNWIEDNKSTIVLTNSQEERILKRRRRLEARLKKPFITKKKMKCVWLVEADTA